MDNMSFYEQYPTKSSNHLVRSLPSSRISFAAGTRFTNRYDRRMSDFIKKSTYNIKPVKKERDSLLRYRAPAATIPVGPYQSVTKLDYTYPSDDLLKAMNPQPKWIYRSKSDAGIGRLVDTDYQYFNSRRGSTMTGEISEQRCESEASGDCRDRYIENAYIKRAVEGNIIPFQIESTNINQEKRHFVPRQIRFTDTLNKGAVARPNSIAKMPSKLPGLIKYNTSDNFLVGKTNHVQQPQTTARVTLYHKPPAAITLDNDMMRTYDKQAKLREMIQK
ncbi:unnamed protein product [Mytilus edulis]|uniref:Uncharacterized protein n=1 Tax=Mytilus edulis TaxID=6550 RepID=A0A8S3Q0D4_MYTED|nr:unnamed protein product [Mytilus edulis]